VSITGSPVEFKRKRYKKEFENVEAEKLLL